MIEALAEMGIYTTIQCCANGVITCANCHFLRTANIRRMYRMKRKARGGTERE